MTDIKIASTVTIKATLELTEPELRALAAIATYGADSFLKVYYKELGTAYMKPYEANLRELLKKISMDVPPALAKIDETRKKLLSDVGYRLTKGT